MVKTLVVLLSRSRFSDHPSASLGARMVAGPADSKRVGMLILAGDDFPSTVLKEFEKWDVNLHVQEVAGAKSTRGLLEYLDEDFGRT